MSKQLKLMADYGCFPLWEYQDGEPVGNLDPDRLALSAELRSALRAWAAAYDRTLNHDYPPDSGFFSPAEEEAFEAEGRRLWQELKSQLGARYKVCYFSSREARLLG